MSTGIVWFRRDLRLTDNPAWAAATAAHDRVIAAFVVDPGLWDRSHPRRIGLLAGHLHALDSRLSDHGGRLWIGSGAPVEVLARLVRQAGAETVHANRDVSPYALVRDREAARALPMQGWDGVYVHPPGSIKTQNDTDYTVFTPFHKRWAQLDWPSWPEAGDTLVSADPGESVPDAPPAPMEPGENAALGRLDEFLERVDRYKEERNRPDLDSTSRLSIDLKWGTIAARTVAETVGTETPPRAAFVRQLAWRDFYAHVMNALPHTAERSMRPEYDAVPWREDPDELAAWKEGRTGYPLVDAGMRQLIGEGWMHNRVRMIAASFLVKDLLIDWRRGERHFRRLLLDGDVPQNIGNWQWVAGTGADAAPYFRIFNPTTQSKKFDPDGDYIRRWVPELAGVTTAEIHDPSTATREENGYPAPLVDHSFARERTLSAYASVKG